MSQEEHIPNRNMSATPESRDGADQNLQTEPNRSVLSSVHTVGTQLNLKNTVRVLDPFNDEAFIEMFFEQYTKERVQEVTMCKGEALVTFSEAKGAELALCVPKIMAGKPISVYAVDPSEQQNIHVQKDNKTSSEKVCCDSCKKYVAEADRMLLVCGHHRPCRGCSRKWDRTCLSCGVITVSCDVCKNDFDKDDTLPLVCGHQRVCRVCRGKWDCWCSLCGVITVSCDMCNGDFDEKDIESLVCGHQRVCRSCSGKLNCTCSSCGVTTVYCEMCKNNFDKDDTAPLACGHQHVCRTCIGERVCICSTCGVITVYCISCKKGFAEADTEALVCGHQSVCRACNSSRDCSNCTTCGRVTVCCVTCKKGFEEADTEPLVCGHQSVCRACNSTRDCSTCTTCGKNTVRCVTCKKAFEEAETEPLVCGHQSVCRACNSLRDCSTCTTCGQITVRCVTCKKSFEEADTEPLICGHQSVCNACIMTSDSSTCTICGKITVRCVICKKDFEETDTEALVCGHQSVCRACNSTRGCSTCTTCGKNTVRCVSCKKAFDETDTESLVCGHQSVCRACNSLRNCSTCTTCGQITGSSSFGDIEVNPNKKQTDKQNQRLESSEYTFEPDKEQRGTDKEKRMKSSVSTPREMHERPSGYKVKATHVRNINVRDKSDKYTCDVTGLVVIPRDIMVVCDNNNSSVKLVDTKQNIVTAQIRLPSKPWDTALVPRDVTEESTTYDLIVTLPGARKLRYVRVTGDQITDTNKDISVEGFCRGIQVTQDRKLAVSYSDLLSGKVEILDMDGQVLRRLQTDHGGAQLFHRPYHLAVSPGSGILYVSDWGNNTLTSISTRDWSVITKLKGLVVPRGVTVDRAGSVFVCCGIGTVHLVAATGDLSTQILGKEDGLCGSPGAIGLSPEGDRMYVSGLGSDHVQEFQLTESDN